MTDCHQKGFHGLFSFLSPCFCYEKYSLCHILLILQWLKRMFLLPSKISEFSSRFGLWLLIRGPHGGRQDFGRHKALADPVAYQAGFNIRRNRIGTERRSEW